ncbi:non-functional NADPH-dependent codeinone reductase 2-like [Neltuma alba]|uniref:non-functional NADPH-dependent codeinone reductase 2-like n=1 Tax=Neltuma alba TaxID=207710 RepID=UPI0010A2F686|nr:non-functional NADPH-dependent codeinone reductase 2-like [Prosopis alba]
MTSNQIRLNCGITMPLMGFGTYSYPFNRKTTELAILNALKVGYRHFDTAKIYGSEEAVGSALNKAMQEGVIEREDIFLTSKLWGSDHHDPVSALKQSLRNVGMEYLDMYLVHWPVKLKPWVNYPVPNEEDFEKLDIESTWIGMQKCLEMGLCRCIGVSNFSSTKIESLLDSSSTPPAVNQVEMHPMWKQRKLRETCGAHEIHVSAYSPLGGPGNAWGSTAVVDHPIVQSIASKRNSTPAQVALRWGLSKGSSVIVKSFNEERMKENMASLDLNLDHEDMFEIEKMEEKKIMRGEFLVNQTTSPFRTIQQLWDHEI